MSTSVAAADGATAVITHRVRSDRHAEYEHWLQQISPRCRNARGHLDWQIVRPLPGVTDTYTVILRFDTVGHLKAWMGSEERMRLLAAARPLLDGDDHVHINSGLEFLFTPAGTRPLPPVRWKQFLVTWSAIYPLALVAPLLITPLAHRLGLPDHRLLDGLLVTAVVVFLMVYVVMPHYTRWVQGWLFRH